MASLDRLDTPIKTFKETKLTLNEFTRAFNISFALREKNGRYECTHSDNTFVFSISLREEGLSFGEAMGYCLEKERPVVDPVDAIYDACYCDGDSLDAIFMYGSSFTGATDKEQLRNLLDSAFARDEEQSEDWS